MNHEPMARVAGIRTVSDWARVLLCALGMTGLRDASAAGGPLERRGNPAGRRRSQRGRSAGPARSRRLPRRRWRTWNGPPATGAPPTGAS